MNKDKFYICGGKLRRTVFQKLEEWESVKLALLVEVDPQTGTGRSCIEYESPKEVTADDKPPILFKYATPFEQKLFTCTSTEVIVYDLPSLKLKHYISLPIFNDLHHVLPTKSGTVMVAITGLDIIVEVSLDGKVLRQWDVMGQDTWSIHTLGKDYRKVPTTKPHRAHANHVFLIGEEVWATRSRQRDAISLQDPSRRIEIGIQNIHEGFFFRDELYFTVIDGHIAVVNPKTLKVDRVYNLTEMSGPLEVPLGFCRGLLMLDQRFAWVCFTRIRPTKFRENLSWVRHPTREQRRSHVRLYDLQKGECLQQIETEPFGIGIVANLLKF